MCVLQPCENPTEEGAWWRDDTEWRRYGAQHEALIKKGIKDQLHQIDLGTIVSPVHPKGARYVVNLQKMEQVAVSSEQKRPVMVVDMPMIETVDQEGPPEQTFVPRRSFKTLSLHLHYRDSTGNLQRYDPDIEQALLNSMASGSQRTLLLPDGKSGHYFFDLEAMEQRSALRVVNGRPIFSNEAPVQIIAEVPWDACAMASIAAKADKALRRKILVVVIEKFRCNENLDTLLAEKACPRRIISKNTSRCSAASYEKFVDSVEEVLERLPTDRMGDIIKSAGMEQDGSGPVKIAFKPVERSARSSADLDKSSDKALKSKAAFWISMAAPLAAAQASVYGCAVQLKILAYLVIVPASVWSKAGQTVGDECSGYVVVDKPEHGLPLAEVTVC